jgi:hypothetical protein
MTVFLASWQADPSGRAVTADDETCAIAAEPSSKRNYWMPQTLLPTSLVGSYAQPDWLIDRKKLASRFPPRVRAKELWRVAPEFLDQAQDALFQTGMRRQRCIICLCDCPNQIK